MGSDFTVQRPWLWLGHSSSSGQHFGGPEARSFKHNFPRPDELKSVILHPAEKEGDSVNHNTV